MSLLGGCPSIAANESLLDQIDIESEHTVKVKEIHVAEDVYHHIKKEIEKAVVGAVVDINSIKTLQGIPVMVLNPSFKSVISLVFEDLTEKP